MLSIRLKELRISHSLTQVDFAQKLSVTKQTVSNWENNNIQPSIDMLVKIADYFNISTDYLLGRETNMQINVEGLSTDEIAHINMIIKDLKKN
ncbi:MAG: helix-turn-helix transcriptional regulator [Clostridia bacterium]|nr:helix-turn-helix transcriptional regulator [Clostridia bacterium]